MPIKVGISSWTEKTLVESGFYPPAADDAASRLRFYASRFPLAEIDSPYYALPTRHQAEVWAERTPPGFTFNVKAYALFTGHYTDPARLPKDLQGRILPSLRSRPHIYPRDVDDELMAELSRRFADALQPLKASGKLGVVLFQYPAWMPIGAEGFRQLIAARGLLPGFRIAVEFRNATWLSERNRAETLSFLRAHGLAYACVDEPQGFPSSVPPVAETTAPIAVVRFHGRNRARWTEHTRSAGERMDYLYSRAELESWVPKIRRLAQQADEVHVVMNNCHRDHAVRNAEDLMDLLGVGRPAFTLEHAPGS